MLPGLLCIRPAWPCIFELAWLIEFVATLVNFWCFDAVDMPAEPSALPCRAAPLTALPEDERWLARWLMLFA